MSDCSSLGMFQNMKKRKMQNCKQALQVQTSGERWLHWRNKGLQRSLPKLIIMIIPKSSPNLKPQNIMIKSCHFIGFKTCEKPSIFCSRPSQKQKGSGFILIWCHKLIYAIITAMITSSFHLYVRSSHNVHKRIYITLTQYTCVQSRF